MDDKERIALSKLLALLLRHRAGEHGLALDPEGFAPLDDVLAAINRRRGWSWVRAEHVAKVIARQEKRRYEIVDGDIRAIYGHSLATAISYPVITPPDALLHGTARRFVEVILREGLRPMSRQYVHLTDDPALARLTGRRRDPDPAILLIDATRANTAGVTFFRADNGVFLAKAVPPEYIAARLYDDETH
jgi:putative RNA 2'-phosphotransferase